MATCLSGAASFGIDRPPIVAPFSEGVALFDYTVGNGSPIRGVGPGMQAAADELIGDQCLTGGWGWSPHRDCSETYNNITAPIALGLLHAYAETGDPDHLAGALAGGNYDVAFTFSNSEARFGSFMSYFLWRLSLASGDPTYSDHAATGFFDELDAGTYGPSNLNTAGWIASVLAARTGAWVNLRPWEFHTIIPTAAAIGNAGQAAAFESACRDGLNTLNNVAPASVYSDILGLAGGVRGLAFAGATSFSAIAAPNHSGVNGISTLEDLADLLAGYQNADGSWYWHSNLGLLGLRR